MVGEKRLLESKIVSDSFFFLTLSTFFQMIWFRENWYEELLRQLNEGLSLCQAAAFESRADGRFRCHKLYRETHLHCVMWEMNSALAGFCQHWSGVVGLNHHSASTQAIFTTTNRAEYCNLTILYLNSDHHSNHTGQNYGSVLTCNVLWYF